MDAVEEIKSRLSIEDVVSEYVQLKRAGRNFKGLSPFGAEKTPSFMVSPEKQIWHDFSSGKGGDMFSFVMLAEGLDFKATLELLARKAGIDLDQYRTAQPGQSSKVKERLHEALELAAKFYQVQFSKNHTAIEYVFKKRKYTKATALMFRLGYAPNNGTALVDFLKGKGFTDQELQQSGLSAKRYHGVGDMFRGRLMVPLQDPQGRIIGFTARLLVDDPNAPKYINTPQTVLYDKSRHVYGLHLAKDALRTSGFAVLVEGNLDVIASHQAGVKQTVATAGTALTEMHLKALHRFTSDVRLCFDADKAGQAAAERAIPIASKVGVSLRMVLLEGGKDPDELIQKDPSLWEQAIGKPQDVLDWLMDRYALQLDLATAPGKRQFSDIMLHVVRQLTDQVEQDHYLEAIARRIDTSKSALEAKLKGVDAQSAQPRKRVKPQGPVDQQLADRVKAQNHFLSLMLLRPALREYLDKVDKAMFTQPEAIALYSFLCSHRDFKGEVATARSLQSIADYIKIITLLHEALYQDVSDAELAYEAARLHVRLTDQFVKTKKADIAHALQTADEAETTRLLQAVKRLDNLLNNAKELDHAPKSQT